MAGQTPVMVFVLTGWRKRDTSVTLDNTVYHGQHLPLFVENGADLTATNDGGCNVLHLLASRRLDGEFRDRDLTDDLEGTFKKFLDLGVDPRAEDFKMRTAIDCAVVREWDGIVRLFKGEGKQVILDEDGGGDEQSEPDYEMVNSTHSESDTEMFNI